MPTYDYACRDCGEEFEIVQSFTEDPLTECPACGGDLRKRYSPVGITFRGSGFYKTDSRGSSGGSSGKSAPSSEPTTSTSTADSSTSTSTSESSTAAKGS